MSTTSRFLLAALMTIPGGLLSSCYYEPYAYGTSPRTSVSSSVGYNSGGHVSSSLFIRTSNNRWGYDPHCRSYYDYTTRCYYDPYLRGYYPRGYRPPVIIGAPHPHGWRPGMKHCPPPSHVRNHRIANHHQRQDHYRRLKHSWAKNVRCPDSGSNNHHRGSNRHTQSQNWNRHSGNHTQSGTANRGNGRSNTVSGRGIRGGSSWQNRDGSSTGNQRFTPPSRATGHTRGQQTTNRQTGRNSTATPPTRYSSRIAVNAARNRAASQSRSANRSQSTSRSASQTQSRSSSAGRSQSRGNIRQAQSNPKTQRMEYARARVQEIQRSRNKSR